MKNILIFIISIFGWSQESSPDNNFFALASNEEVENEHIISAKNCYVRAEPRTNSTLIDSLQLGNKITFIKDTKIGLNIKGLDLSWVEIEYKKDNQTKKGYLWKGFIALNINTFKTHQVITSIDRKFIKKVKSKEGHEYDETQYGFTIKILHEDNTISEKSFTKPVIENYYITSKTMGNWGLKDITFIYKIGFNGEACAIPSEYLYFGWNGKEIIKIIEKYDVGDANAYYYSEDLIFPKEKGGQANTIIKKCKEASNTDDSLETTKFIVNEKTEYFSWDGKQLKLEKTTKKKPYNETY